MNTVHYTTATTHAGTEAALTEITLNPKAWEKDRTLSIPATGSDEFTNEHWKQYLNRFIELAPRKLIIQTSILTDITGARLLTSVEELCIGNDIVPIDTGLMLKQPEVLEMIKEIAQMPAIKGFAVASHVPYMGELNMQRTVIDCLQEIRTLFQSIRKCSVDKTGLRVNIALPIHGEAF